MGFFLKSESGAASALAGAGPGGDAVTDGGLRALGGGKGTGNGDVPGPRSFPGCATALGLDGPCSCLRGRDKVDIGGGGFLQGLSRSPRGTFQPCFPRTQSQGYLILLLYPGRWLTPLHLSHTDASGGMLGGALGHLWVPWRGAGWWLSRGAGTRCCTRCRGLPAASALPERRQTSRLLGARLARQQLIAKLTRASGLSPHRANLGEQALPQTARGEKLERRGSWKWLQKKKKKQMDLGLDGFFPLLQMGLCAGSLAF